MRSLLVLLAACGAMAGPRRRPHRPSRRCRIRPSTRSTGARATPAFAIDPGGLYDLAKIGVPIVTNGGYVHDGTRVGVGVGGHPFLADLGRDAPAVIEYLKTL